MARIYRTSRGEGVDMDMLRLSNENIIAIGNMRTNARGDELGKGGQVVKTKAQIMQEYHKLNTPVVDNSPVTRNVATETAPVMEKKLNVPVVDNSPVTRETAPTEYVKPRGSFAGAVAGQTEVTQELLEPAATRGQAPGVSRI